MVIGGGEHGEREKKKKKRGASEMEVVEAGSSPFRISTGAKQRSRGS